MAFMKAVVKDGRSAAVRSVAIPVPGPDEVRIRVRLAGLCCTDVLAAHGLIPTREGIILGHEFSGEIDAVGREGPS